MERNYKYLFSIIMSVYNVEEYIREAVDSVIGQNFDFSKVQIIFVDDGSTDTSGAICEEYREKYPENIVVVHKANGGLSSAKNAGLKYAEGKYINFFDPDDILSDNTLSSVFEFFEEHFPETDIVSIPLYFFEALTGAHQLNDKFKRGSRVIDLAVEHTAIQSSGASSFYKCEVIKGITFDEALLTSEDLKANLQILLEKKTLGVVSNVKYMYRRRLSANQSLLTSTKEKKEYYTKYLKNVAQYSIDYCLKNYAYIPRFIQNALFYDLCWKYKRAHIPQDEFTPEEFSAFQQDIFAVLKYFDDDIIMNSANCDDDLKWFLRWKKHELLGFPDGKDFFLARWMAVRTLGLVLDFFSTHEDGVTIEGRVTIPAYLEGIRLYTYVNGEKYPCELSRVDAQDIFSVDCLRSCRYQFKSDIVFNSAAENYDISYAAEFMGREYSLSKVSLAKYFPITNSFKRSYFAFNGRKLTKNCGVLRISKASFFDRVKSELSLLNEFRLTKKLGYKKAIVARLLYCILKLFKRREIWLVSDKADKADDNGEAFFLYLNKKNNKNIRSYFLLGKDSVDYKRMQSIGKVIPYMSKLHKFIYLFADYTISAYSHNEINNPFQEQVIFYTDIIHKCKYVFLQHGVSEKNVCDGLNRFHKNIVGLITSAPREKASMAKECSYADSMVWLTGLPRFDRLYDAADKTITIMPTWRRFLFIGFSAKNDRWELRDGFRESEYYKYYYGIIDNERLISAAKKLGYKLLFVPHSVLFPYIDQFEQPKYAELVGYGTSYRDMFARSSLIITDYSSAVFDVAYLRKPVLYTQFDSNRYFSEHYKQGYFNYERDGFGEVEYDVESTVDRIIEYMENDCKLKDKYRERIDNFFAYSDKNCCERVYERIIQFSRESNL